MAGWASRPPLESLWENFGRKGERRKKGIEGEKRGKGKRVARKKGKWRRKMEGEKYNGVYQNGNFYGKNREMGIFLSSPTCDCTPAYAPEKKRTLAKVLKRTQPKESCVKRI